MITVLGGLYFEYYLDKNNEIIAFDHVAKASEKYTDLLLLSRNDIIS